MAIRLLDIALSALVLLLTAPLLIVVALLIKVTSPGPVFYRAVRVGRGGRPFRMCKFRTMVVAADRMGPTITSRKDPRITPVGHFLRRTKIDELPQFINVLMGDMAIVGPRPEVPEIVARYDDTLRRSLDYRPGVTSPGTLHYAIHEEADIPPGQDAEEYYVRFLLRPKLERDLAYLDHRSLGGDVRIILATLRYVLASLCGRAIPASH